MTFFEILKEIAYVVGLIMGSCVVIFYILAINAAFFDTHTKVDNINDWMEEQKKKNGEMEE